MRTHRPLVSFDWALKRLLRSRANFVVLEGFLSELLKTDIEILEVLESTSIQDPLEKKMNVLDLKVKTKRDEIMIIEVRYDGSYSFFHRILYSTSRIVLDYLTQDENDEKVKKVISVNLLYFDSSSLWKWKDYVYYGTTIFKGMHYDDTLDLSPKYITDASYKETIFPEYYLIKISQFNNEVKDTLDEWIYFLKNTKIYANFSAKGLKEAEEVFQEAKLSQEELEEFDYYLDVRRTNDGFMQTKFEEGFAKGIAKAKKERIEKMIKQGMSHAAIANILEISESDVQKLMD